MFSSIWPKINSLNATVHQTVQQMWRIVINALFNDLAPSTDALNHLSFVHNNVELLLSSCWSGQNEFTHTLLMYLHPQTVLHPHASDSYFHSQVFDGFNGGVFKVGGSASFMSVKFSCVIPGIVFSGGGESMCGDSERIRGKSISIILTKVFDLRQSLKIL